MHKDIVLSPFSLFVAIILNRDYNTIKNVFIALETIANNILFMWYINRILLILNEGIALTKEHIFRYGIQKKIAPLRVERFISFTLFY